MSRAVVVGGGVVGAAAAYYLADAGCRVTVVDRGKFGAACSHANCGYVSPSHVLPLAGPGVLWRTVKSLLDPNSPFRVRPGTVLRDPGWFLGFARRCNERNLRSGGAALRPLLASSRALYDELIRTESLSCEWDPRGLVFVFQSRPGMEHYAEVDHLLREQFDTPARRLDGDALAAYEPALKPGLAGGWLYECDAHLRPDRLMAELHRVLVARGVEVRENCPVTGFVRGGSGATAVRTAAGDLPADVVVVAAGAWSPSFAGDLGCRVPVQPGKGYSITYPPLPGGPAVPMIFEEHRVAVTPFQTGFRIGSTMEFAGYDDRLNRNRLRILTDGAAHYLKLPPTGTPTEEWWGWRPMTPDSVPLIGRAPKLGNVWLAAGHNMLGLTLATGTGKLVAELATGRTPHLDPTPYSPARFG